MKRVLLVLFLVTLTFGAYAQGNRHKRKAKQAEDENLPVMSVFKAANDEQFILFFAGKKINEKPASMVEVKGVNLNEPYNTRVVVKSPRVTANMNFRLITLTKQGETYYVHRNVKRDNVEILTQEEYDKICPKSSIQPYLKRNVKKLEVKAKDTLQNQQVIVVEPDKMILDTADLK